MSSCSCVVRLIALTIYYRKARVDRLASCKLLRARSVFGQTALVVSEIIGNAVSICRRFWSFWSNRRLHRTVWELDAGTKVCCTVPVISPMTLANVDRFLPRDAHDVVRCSSVTIRCSVERMNGWNWFWHRGYPRLILQCGCKGHRISPKIRRLVGLSLTSLFSTNTAISQTKGKKQL